jgi:hypothetical protein
MKSKTPLMCRCSASILWQLTRDVAMFHPVVHSQIRCTDFKSSKIFGFFGFSGFFYIFFWGVRGFFKIKNRFEHLIAQYIPPKIVRFFGFFL